VAAADQGALTDDGFKPLRDLGLPGNGRYAIGGSFVRSRLEGGPYRLVVGQVLTLSCMTGTADRAAELAARHPRAVAEAMEGYGVLEAVRREGARSGHDPLFAEVRAISNLVGPRDRSTWDIPAALTTLTAAGARLAGGATRTAAS
jgi:futalosine hydrolase